METFSVHNVNKIKKPDGKAVVEIHQMLESGLARRSSFIFFSDSFLEAAEDREYNLSDVKTPLPGVGIIYHQDV
ncbi:hypothetical protein [Sphingobacterium daejeonense]|uniref:hypothetical protein n=1 Tax=Sphingobacterium daejeonense TaxID=371142 RepID=UPI0010C30B08|nr:hypothetical protein [Sphingobacterium daejeonense]VTP91665.1 Uncharacterised protein [Sphingobacterium daejeonense]